MLNKLKRKIITEVINELQDLCNEYDAKLGVKVGLDEDVTYEAGVCSGIRKAIGKVYDIKSKYR